MTIWKFWKKDNKPTPEVMSFKEALDLAELPVVTFYQGNHKLNFLLDTGANYSVINKDILKKIKTTPSKETAMVYGIEGIGTKVNFTNIDFTYKSTNFTEAFQIIDMTTTFNQIKKESGVQLHGIIGNGFMQKYKYVLDFADMIAYIKQ